MDEFTRFIRVEILWNFLFTDNIVLVEEPRYGVNTKLEI